MEEALNKILRVYKDNKTLVLSTFGDSLWSSRIYFASRGLDIYAMIEKSRNYENILKNKKVSFVIDKGVPDLFVQGEGEVEILGKPEEREDERALLFQKNMELIPFVKKNRDVLVIRLRPQKIFLSDFRSLFKPREEVTVTEEILKKALDLDKGEPAWKIYLKATRPFAFTATLVSVLAGAMLAQNIDFFLLFLTLLGILFLHAGVNALNDLMDFRYGADDWLVLGASRVLQDKLMTEKQQFVLSFVLIVLGSLIGFVLVGLKGIEVLFIGAAGVFLGVFYQVKPLGLKYRALGDFAVFMAFGPLLVLGSYYVQTGMVSWVPVLVAIPLGLLVIGILHGNNMRDLIEDIQCGYRTVASYLGLKGSSYYYIFLVGVAYLMLPLLVYFKVLPWQSLLAFISLPIGLKNIRLSLMPDHLQFGMLDLFTARLHLIFGLLIVLGMALSKLSLA